MQSVNRISLELDLSKKRKIAQERLERLLKERDKLDQESKAMERLRKQYELLEKLYEIKNKREIEQTKYFKFIELFEKKMSSDEFTKERKKREEQNQVNQHKLNEEEQKLLAEAYANQLFEIDIIHDGYYYFNEKRNRKENLIRKVGTLYVADSLIHETVDLYELRFKFLSHKLSLNTLNLQIEVAQEALQQTDFLISSIKILVPTPLEVVDAILPGKKVIISPRAVAFSPQAGALSAPSSDALPERPEGVPEEGFQLGKIAKSEN